MGVGRSGATGGEKVLKTRTSGEKSANVRSIQNSVGVEGQEVVESGG
jgi:hypothetical protein